MALDLTFYLVAVPAVLVAGISKGGFGSGAAFVAAPMLALVVDPIMALGIMLPLLMLIDVASLRAYWGRWDRASTRLLVFGSLPGIALGAVLARSADPDLFRLLIGTIALAFVVWQLVRRFGQADTTGRDFPRWVGLLAGTAAGFTSFISHAGGPVVAVYLLSKGHGKTTYQATSVIVFWAINVIKFVPYAMLGFFTAQTLAINLMLAPVALLGTWLGVRAHRLVPEPVFFLITYVLLVGTGTKLIWDALT